MSIVPRIPLPREPAPEAANAGAMSARSGLSSNPQALGDYTFTDLHDPQLYAFLRDGVGLNSGAIVNVRTAMRNTAVFRCVSLISYAIGMLPLHLIRNENGQKAKDVDHPLFKLLHREPNNWQTAFDFRSYMQNNALVFGNAYARVVRSRGRIIRLVPIHPDRVSPRQNDDWSVSYVIDGTAFSPDDILHIRGLSDDGIVGMSLVRQAAEAIGLAQQMEAAAARQFRNGMMVGGVISHPGKLGPEATKNLIASLETRYASVENAHKWMVFEEGMKAEKFGQSAVESQHNEMRAHQIEEISRVFGVPRPFMFMDDTSWGTGIDVLGQFFVRYGLNPWFEAWQQAIERTLLTTAEKDVLEVKFNPGGLLRGSMTAQADFFAKALGAGGAPGWMQQNEVRDAFDLNQLPDGDKLNPGATAAPQGSSNDPSPTPSD